MASAATSPNSVARASAARAAGMSRRKRRTQKALRSTEPVAARSANSNDVMRKPESVKKVETPR